MVQRSLFYFSSKAVQRQFTVLLQFKVVLFCLSLQSHSEKPSGPKVFQPHDMLYNEAEFCSVMINKIGFWDSVLNC